MSERTESKAEHTELNSPFPISENRFDERMHMFSRVYWGEEFIRYKNTFYKNVIYQKRAGYKKLDYAFRNASFRLSRGYDYGNIGMNDRFYSRDGSANRYKTFIDTGGKL